MKPQSHAIAIFFIVVFICDKAAAQSAFWTEDFGTGCNQGQQANAYPGPNGAWSSFITGVNAANASNWYISATENGNEPGECGTGCGDDRTLHMGAVSIFGSDPDPGAAYYEGLAGFCFILPCGATDKRAQSPFIDCSAYTDITMEFDYIEGGNAIDNATVWYYNGTTWSQIADTPKTFSGLCTPQGIWTHYSVTLPASANNNPNVRIGFRWVNNEDGDATDPSFAVDDIVLSVAGDTEPPVISECPVDQQIEDCSFVLPDYTTLVNITDNVDLSPEVSQTPPPGSVISGEVTVTITATDDDGNAGSCAFVINVFDITPPQIICPEGPILSGTDPGDCHHVLSDYGAVAGISDNCDSSPVYLQDPPPGSLVMANETIDVTLLASDASGNTAVCTFSVTVEDNEAPQLECTALVSDTLEITTDASMWMSVPAPLVTENCTDYILTNSFNGMSDAGDVYAIGIWDVTFSATDGSGNQSSCITQVEVMPVPCCPFDFDCNYVINVSDLLTFMVYFGTFSGPADFNGDGAVNIGDLLLFMSNYGLFCP